MSNSAIYRSHVILTEWNGNRYYGFDEESRVLFCGWRSFTNLNMYVYRSESTAPFKYDGTLECASDGSIWFVVSQGEWWRTVNDEFNSWEKIFNEMVKEYFEKDVVYRLYTELRKHDLGDL